MKPNIPRSGPWDDQVTSPPGLGVDSLGLVGATMPGYRAPIRSKGKQQTVAAFYREQCNRGAPEGETNGRRSNSERGANWSRVMDISHVCNTQYPRDQPGTWAEIRYECPGVVCN